MSVNLILSISQETAETPYQFKITGINVYSFEEALYHVFHYWKQSIDDFTSDGFVDWVGGALQLSFLAAKIKEIAPLTSLSRKLALFLSLTDYFDGGEVDALRKDVMQWENRKEWEKLKERGDYLMHQGEPEKAFHYYKKALDYGENRAILNNIAIALMKSENYTEAIRYLSRALRHTPMDYHLSLHLAEAHILNREAAAAQSILESLKKRYGDRPEIQFFHGEISFAQGDYLAAAACYEKIISVSAGEEAAFIYRLADAYVKLRFYDKALAALDKVQEKDKQFMKKQADVFVASGNIPAAIGCMQKALVKSNTSVDLWVRLAQYYRMNYDLQNASGAITKALELSKKNPRANLENARIKKALGKIKEYQAILNTVLAGFKEKYRENEYDTNG